MGMEDGNREGNGEGGGEGLPTSLGFIGLGAMGYPMARNLALKLPPEARIYVFDVVETGMVKLVEELGDEKVIRCGSPVEVGRAVVGTGDEARKHPTILTMLPEGSHVRTVYLDHSTGLLNAPLTPNLLLLDCSTIDTSTSLAISTTLSQSHPETTFHDAPVSGGVRGASKATLTFMLGCADTSPSYPRVHLLLRLMGAHIFPCGGPSLGLTAKLCNNYCSALITLATSEALNIGIRSGMDPRVLSAIFQASTAGSTINEKWNPVPGICPEAPPSRGYEPGFRVELMRKDFGLACEVARNVGARTVLAGPGLEAYEGAVADERCSGLDSRVVYRWLGGDEGWAERFEK